MRCANISPSKRSFDDTAYPHQHQHQHHQSQHHHHYLHYHLAHYASAVASCHSPTRQNTPPPYSPSKRRSSFSQNHSMLAERTTIMSGSFPSFMSVFGSEESGLYRPTDLDDQNNSKLNEHAFPLMTTHSANTQSPLQHQHLPPHEHRGSINSLTFSESTESSPTTTNSTFDSPLVSDTSASSSPESATSMAPSTPFRSGLMPMQGQQPNSFVGATPFAANQTQPQAMLDAAKNVKKLTLDMNLSSLQRPATTGSLEPNHTLSAPTSPLKEPMKSARKKPTNLTIRTPGYNQLTFPRTGNVPATPNQRPALHHMQSSPALASLASPRGPPVGGMTLPLPSLNTQYASQSSNSSNGSSSLANSMPELREETENLIPKSQEAPEKGYTEGPVCIYDCGVYLYLEPTADEARNFDTVINVAKEIRNPFKSQRIGEGTVMSVWRAEPPSRNSIKEPQTAVSEYSFKSAWEWPQPESTTTPTATTPTQSSFALKPKQPEYIHVRWDHNSEILGDLYPLCKIIDSRIAEGKKVLIHCQLGVSRSASLIIAYGLYKDYQPNFHSMYTAVKSRSRWVGPNMSLIYQLTDFKNKLKNGDFERSSKEPHPDWFVPSPDGPLTPTVQGESCSKDTKADNEANAKEDRSQVEKVAPLKLNKALPPVPLFPGTKALPSQVSQTPNTVPVLGPPLPSKASTTVKRAASRPLPFRERHAEMSIPAHRPRVQPGFASVQPRSMMDLAMSDVPSTPSLFSPRATEFAATPFGIRGSGDLEQPRNRLSKEIPANFNWLPLRKEGHIRTASKDPRSPHQKAESKEIFRSIDGYL